MARKKSTNSLFAYRLLQLMNQKQLTQNALAIRADITQGAISDYLRSDRVPGSSELGRLAQALGVSMDYLWGLSDTPPDKDTSMSVELLELKGALKFAVGTLEGALGTLKKHLPVE